MDDIEIEHVGGVAWHQAPIPRRWHRCRAQTYGQHGLDQIERCACGGIRLNGQVWLERNSR
jgi:hypothetical protein